MPDGVDGMGDGFAEVDEVAFGHHQVFVDFDEGSVSVEALSVQISGLHLS